MNVAEAIRLMLWEQRRTQEWLAHALGYARQSGVASMLSRGSVTVRTLWRICEALGYEIVIQPKGKKRLEGQIVLEGTE